MKAFIVVILALGISLKGKAQEARVFLDSASTLQYKAKDYAAAAKMYSKAFLYPQPYHTYFHRLQAAECAALSGQYELAFTYLEQILSMGYVNAEQLQADAELKALHGERWDNYLDRLAKNKKSYLQSIDPNSYGLDKNIALTQLYNQAHQLSDVQLYQKLIQWNDYPDFRPAKKGSFLRFDNKVNDTLSRPFEVFVPAGYRSNRPATLLLYLPGGWWGRIKIPSAESRNIMFENPTLTYAEQQQIIEVFPIVDRSVALFRDEGYQNIKGIMRIMKERFNIDDDRVFLAGFSDGGSSAYNLASGMPTDFAAIYPINGWLSNSANYVNLASRPIRAYSAEDDMYSNTTMLDKMHFAQRYGADWSTQTIKGEGHFYYPYSGKVLPGLFEDLKKRERSKLPRQINWSVSADNLNRCDWLELTVDTSKHNPHLLKTDTLKTRDMDGEKPVTTIYGNKHPFAKATYADNRFELQTDRIGSVSIYLHPQMINFDAPVTVVINGRKVFDEKVKWDRDLMLNNFMHEPDRSRVYVSKLTLEVF